MARKKSRQGVLKRQREQRKADKKERKRLRRLERLEGAKAEDSAETIPDGAIPIEENPEQGDVPIENESREPDDD